MFFGDLSPDQFRDLSPEFWFCFADGMTLTIVLLLFLADEEYRSSSKLSNHCRCPDSTGENEYLWRDRRVLETKLEQLQSPYASG